MRRPPGARGMTMTELLVTLAILSLLATVMLPRIGQHVERARSAEAILNLGMMAQGALAYAHTEHADPQGTLLPPRFPTGQEFTPDPARCALREDGLCPAAQWTAPTWLALSFSLPGESYYAYGFQSTGAGGGARAVGIALRGGVAADRAAAAPAILCLYMLASGQRYYGPCGVVRLGP